MPINPDFLCPITHEPMTDPVTASDEKTYERYAIKNWLKTGNTSPITREILNRDLTPNNELKQLIDDYYQNNPTAEKRYTVPSDEAAAASDETTDDHYPALPTNNFTLFSPQAPSQTDLTEEEKEDSRTYFNPIFYS
jgi:hypothetical protein